MSSAHRPSHDRVVLDTGPPLTCLALHYLDGTEADKFRRSKVLQDVRRGSDLRFAETEQERFQVLMSRAKRLLTTPHVLAEVLRLRGHPALSQDRERFRRLSLELLADGRIEEISGPLQALCADPEYRELICRLGLTDAAVVYLAAKERCLLLTDEERKFDTYTAGAGFEIRTLDEYLRPPE